MVDDAERWLYVNDPEYQRTSEAWKHVRTGVYVTPAQEVPFGDMRDIDKLVIQGKAKPVISPDWRVCARPRCQIEFVPTVKWQRYCSELCRDAEKKRRKRAA